MSSTGSLNSNVRGGVGGLPSSASSASSASSSSSGSAPKNNDRSKLIAIVLSVLGGIGVIAAVAAQAFAIDHGSNQKPIDANNITTVWSIIIGVIILMLGVAMWFHIEKAGGEYKYMYAYALAFSSYIVASIALYMSTIQVIVRESTN